LLIGKSEIVDFSEKIKAVNAAHGYFVAKQRNKHLQTTLIEAAKMAPRYSPDLAMLYDKQKQKGNANRATRSWWPISWPSTVDSGIFR
jgi:hypothetical protein